MKKKNTFMRLAMVLVLLVLVTTSAVGGTFAKYVTTGSAATGTARVAKFGVDIVASGEEAFKNEYAADDALYTAGNTVVSTVDVVAPGTKGTLATVSVSGTPEVAVNVKYEADLTLSNWKIGSDDYCPLVFKVNGGTPIEFVDTVANLESAVEAALNKDSDFAPNANLANTITVEWEWKFESGDDVKDTALGDQADAGNPATIEFTISCTVTQID